MKMAVFFTGDDIAPPLELKKLEAIFRHRVFKMLLKKGKITEEMVRMLSTWKHSGFNVFCGNRISPKDDSAMENLARYIIRASFSEERMKYLEHEGTVVYRSKDGKDQKTFPAMEWLAAMCSHIPEPRRTDGTCATGLYRCQRLQYNW